MFVFCLKGPALNSEGVAERYAAVFCKWQ